MATKEARQRATAKYEAKKYDKTLIRMEKGKKEEISIHAQERGESLNGFVNRAIDSQMERDKAVQEATGEPMEDASPQDERDKSSNK